MFLASEVKPYEKKQTNMLWTFYGYGFTKYSIAIYFQPVASYSFVKAKCQDFEMLERIQSKDLVFLAFLCFKMPSHSFVN